MILWEEEEEGRPWKARSMLQEEEQQQQEQQQERGEGGSRGRGGGSVRVLPWPRRGVRLLTNR